MPRILLILGLLSTSAVANAGEAQRAGSGPVAKQSSPAAPTAVEALLHAAEAGTAAQAADATRRLAAIGGAEGARGLERLLEHRNCRVRTAALDGVAYIGLRLDGLVDHAREAVADGSDHPRHERLAAVKVLGAIGDGRDMARLLELASVESKDTELRSSAFRAMAALTGARLPYVQSRWAYWWRKQSKRRGALLERAIEAVEDDPSAETTDLFRDVIEHNAVFDLPYTTAIVERWLRSGNKQLVVVACHLAGAIRAGDHIEILVSIARRRAADAITSAATAALAQLGYSASSDSE